MEIEIDFTKSAQDNANDYYNKSKKLLSKKAGAEKAIMELEKRLGEAKSMSEPEAKTVKVLKEEHIEWYEKFHWFFTSNGLLAIGGRDAHQNEQLNSKHFEEKDLFFHANVFGADVVILKDGADAPHEIREEVAQFAACHSSAWKDGMHTTDVYAMQREQVSKSTGKGSLGTGAFLLSGERDWYRGMSLGLAMYVKEGKLYSVPLATLFKIKENAGIEKYVSIGIGKIKKSDAAKEISKKLGYENLDSIMQQLPAGSFKVS
ncbi:MAG: DUF814 domain-containing protein [Candidatus Marsarchaeota archaeon]|nr:DUF814 domain-containing protein [Candidatus Marsarchaeota archaeon]